MLQRTRIYIALHNKIRHTVFIAFTQHSTLREPTAMKRTTKTANTAGRRTGKMSAPKLKAAIETAGNKVHAKVEQTETAAISMVERVESMMQSVTSGFGGVKTVGSDVIAVVDNAGRTALGGAVAINGSLVKYSRDVLADTVDVGRKTLEIRSVQDAVELHTAFAERRINAMFHAMSAVNSLTQNNVLAMWAPFADMVKDAGHKISDRKAA
jgi:hypothetical protein